MPEPTTPPTPDRYDFTRRLRDVTDTLIEQLVRARESYGESWNRRGGTGAYMVAMRKVDRLETVMPQYGYDLFRALREDQRPEGIADDIFDLAAYLLLWIEHADTLGVWPKPLRRGVAGSGQQHPELGVTDAALQKAVHWVDVLQSPTRVGSDDPIDGTHAARHTEEAL